MKAVVAAFNQEKALVGAFSVITNLRMELFQALLRRSIVMRAGCQPARNMFPVKGVPLCQNWSQLTTYSEEFDKVSLMDRNDLLEFTKCIIPCTFMEYRVS